MPHAVSLLRSARLARSAKPFMARGGSTRERCVGCRLVPSHCMCLERPSIASRAGVCLLMADIEALKPTNTGWLVADVVTDTFAFGWARTEADPALLALLQDPQWVPCVVFPGEYAVPERVMQGLPASAIGPGQGSGEGGRRPLFILLDATWNEARKMFRKSPYLDRFPVLSLQSGQRSRYTLRRPAATIISVPARWRPSAWNWPAKRGRRSCWAPGWRSSPTTTCRPGTSCPSPGTARRTRACARCRSGRRLSTRPCSPSCRGPRRCGAGSRTRS